MNNDIVWPNKSPSGVHEFGFSWGRELGEDAIATSNWSVLVGDVTLGAEADDVASKTTGIWISGGSVETMARVLNTITTTGGRTFEKVGRLYIRY